MASCTGLVICSCSKPAETVPASDFSNAVSSPLVSTPEADPAAMLASLTQTLRRYSFEHKQVPKTFEAFVATGYIKNRPSPPPGKRFAIDAKKVRVMLVDQ